MTDVTEAATPGISYKASPPAGFRVIAVVALLWFLMDISAFFMRVLMSEDGIKGMPANQQHLYRNMPLRVNIVFAGEVFGGALTKSALAKGWLR